MQRYFATLLLTVSLAYSTFAKGTCAGGDEFWDMNRFFRPEILDQDGYKPFFFTFNRLYDYAWDEPAAKYKSNTQEWKAYLQNQATEQDIEAVVYEYSLEDVRKIWGAVKNSGSLPSKAQSNSMVKALYDKKDVATCEYLLFAKSCEPHVNQVADSWEETTQPADKGKMEQLINDGKTRCQNAPNTFLKLRYAFQIIRLAHYKGDFQNALALYDKYAASINEESNMKYWTLAQKAGALKGAGKTAEANYLFSVVFDKCLSKRVPMYYSFKFNKDADWNAAFKLCKTPREQTTMYLLRAIDPESKTTEEMENIYRIDPQSEYLSLLVSREINKVECWLMDYDFNYKYPIEVHENEYTGSNEEAIRYLNELSVFVAKKVNENKVKDIEVWQLGLGYLQLLQGNFNEAMLSFTAAKPNIKRESQKLQLRTLQFLVRIAQIQNVTPQQETDLLTEYKRMKFIHERDSANVLRCMEEVFSRSYEKQGQKGKAFLADKSFYPLYENPDYETIMDLQKLVDKAGKTGFETYLVSKIGDNPKEVLKDMEATHYLRENQLDKAAAIFKQLPASFLSSERGLIYANPFNGDINDCHDCTYEKYKTNTKFTKLWVVERMLEMEQAAKNDPSKAAENYILLANAWYNMSYYGPAWRALAYYRPSSAAEVYVNDKGVAEPDAELIVRDMTRAIDFYQKAKAATSDKEVQAKCAFMLAKCYQNQQYSQIKTGQKQWKSQFSELKQTYATTKYYQEILKECGYFQAYVKGK